jgi:phosphatidylinositol alpha-mannosyltransferase
MVKRLLKKWFNKLNGRIAVSRPASVYINKHFPSTYEIIPNGIDLNRFSPERALLPELKDDKINILFVGRLEKRKGLEYLIKAYRLIKPDCPNCRLIVVGPGNRTRHKYEKEIAEMGLSDVIFTGNVDYEMLPRYYKTADIFVAPATGHESFGIILLEAMATGKPVVASNISGYASVITDGSEGILVPPKQEVPLAQAIRILMQNSDLRGQMGQKGLQTASNFGWDKVSRRVMDYYTKILISKNIRV